MTTRSRRPQTFTASTHIAGRETFCPERLFSLTLYFVDRSLDPRNDHSTPPQWSADLGSWSRRRRRRFLRGVLAAAGLDAGRRGRRLGLSN